MAVECMRQLKWLPLAIGLVLVGLLPGTALANHEDEHGTLAVATALFIDGSDTLVECIEMVGGIATAAAGNPGAFIFVLGLGDQPPRTVSVDEVATNPHILCSVGPAGTTVGSFNWGLGFFAGDELTATVQILVNGHKLGQESSRVLTVQ